MGFFTSIDVEYWWGALEELDKRVKDLIIELFTHELVKIFVRLNKCESPIEQLFGIALLEVAKTRVRFQHIILPQSEIQCSDKKYRVDFLVLIGDYIDNKEGCSKLVIECDGHDFHEKTKEQAARDKQRDRNLIAAGYQVMHFTGSEIWNNPFKCARETVEMILKIYEDRQKD